MSLSFPRHLHLLNASLRSFLWLAVLFITGTVTQAQTLGTPHVVVHNGATTASAALVPTYAWSATTTSGAPTAREDQTAVAAGVFGNAATAGRTIMWGGDDGTAGHTDGGVYNPTTNSWTATSLTNVPTVRTNLVSVWTGATGNSNSANRMIVWGGDNDNNVLPNTGGVYNPATNTWTATTTTGAPAGRDYPQAVWTGNTGSFPNKMIVFGGFDANFNTVNTGGIYDPATDSWTATSTVNAPTGRWNHTMVWTGNTGVAATANKMIVFGGEVTTTSTDTVLGDGGIYDPVTNTWASLPANATVGVRGGHTAVWTGSKMVIFGGESSSFGVNANIGAVYDFGANTWTALPTSGAPAGRLNHTAAWTGDAMIIFGGFIADNSRPNDTRAYDPVGNAWSTLSSTNAPAGRASATGTWSSPNFVVLEGNVSGASNTGGVLSTTPTVAVGSSSVGSALAYSFNLENTGNDSLTGTTVVFSGANASDFSVGTAPSASIAAAGNAAFSINFNPGATGARTAVMSIFSNDPNRSPYNVILTGIGTMAVATPTVTVPGSSITLTAATLGAAGPSVSFNISGSNLTGFTSTLTVTAPANIQVSSDNSTFGGTCSIPYTSATLASTPVYVRLAGTGTPGNIFGNVSITGGGLSTAVNQGVSGTLNSAVTATQSIPAKILTVGQPSANFTPVTGGGGTAPLTYSISPPLPTGLSISPSTGAITGSPIGNQGGVFYTVTVTDANNATASNTFQLAVNTPATATQAVSTKTLTAGQPSVNFTPVTGSGGVTPLTYGISPPLGNGLTLNTSTGAITGVPSGTLSPTIYTVTVTDINGATGSNTFSLTINTAVTATQSIPTKTVVLGSPITAFTPVTGGGGTGTLTYTINPPLPSILAISPSNGSITGTPSATQTASIYTVTVTDTNNATASNTFSLTINPPPPTVIGLNPTSGPGSGFLTVTVSGSNFITGATTVKFGSTAATNVTVSSPNSLTATSPPGTGTVDVTVTTAGGTSATVLADQFTYIPPPAITGISPSSGPSGGGTVVTISGTNFTNAAAVHFGPANATSFSVTNDSTISATAPAGTGTVNINVVTASGTSSTVPADQFTYIPVPSITSISPSAGPTAGGTTVTLTGSNFTGATAVKFGVTNATGVTVNSATSITATSPAGTGTVDVTVTTPSGTSSTSPLDQFTYVAAPVVSSISPTAGPTTGGTSVTITGSNFSGATAVKFGVSNATGVIVNSPFQITATSSPGTGTVDITVTTAGGTSTTGTADQFTYDPVPTVSSINPTSGGTLGGTVVTITGTGFTGATAVSFGGTAAAGFSVTNDTTISATTAAHSAAASLNVSVTTPGGTNTANTFYSYVAVTGTGTTSHSGPAPNNHMRQGGTGTVTFSLLNNGPVSTSDPDQTVAHAMIVTGTLPAGLTLGTLPTGAPWNCVANTTTQFTCTNMNAIGQGSTYQPLVIPVNVAGNAPASVTVSGATFSGAGMTAGTFSSDTITIDPAPILSISKTHSGSFTQGSVATWTLVVSNNSATASGATDGSTVTVTDTLPTGYTVQSIVPGAQWNFSGSTTTQVIGTSTAVVAGSGGSFTTITVNVNVPANSPTSVTNTATVFGGGDLNHTNAGNAASGFDTVSVVQVPASIGLTAGNNQSQLVSTAFPTPFSATVLDANSVPINGTSVSFTAPVSGASGTFANSGTRSTTVNTNASGVATASTYTANSTAGGPYNVAVSAGSITNNFSATNLAATPTIATTQQPASATVGTSIADQATVSGGASPTGTVTFNLYNNPAGTGTPLFTNANVPLSGGAATSSGYTTTAAGTVYWVATYNGDGNNNSVSSSPSGEPVSLNAATPTITTTQQPASAIVGASIADQATVSGGFNPSGTVTFNLYNNPAGTGTPLFTAANVALASGMATSPGYTTTATGTVYWIATYNGDGNNNAVSSGAANAPVTVTPASPTIATTPQPASATVGTSIADKATVSGGFNPSGTVTFKLYNNSTASGTPLFTDTETLSGGTATSSGFTTTANGTDYWVATYNGDSNNNAVTSGAASGPVNIGTVNPTPVQLSTTSTLNRQSGLSQLTVNVTNTTAGALNGFRLHVNYSAYLAAFPTLRLYNASSAPGASDVFVNYPYPVAVGATIAVNLEFYTVNRVMPNPFAPILTVESLMSSETPVINETGTPVSNITKLADKTVLLQWSSVAGNWYRVSYSSDMVHWYDSPTPIQAGSNAMQWIDSGPPFTSISPADPSVTSRFYIVNQIPTP